ncbi:MAG: GAF domain-containing protein [Deltaproteobacteria bacterium]|nr:GAF domain-containing protein [Deltaproteobacteria bacterium]
MNKSGNSETRVSEELDRMRRRITDLEAVEAECRMAQQGLEKTVESQNALNSLLKHSLDEVSLECQMAYFLEVLLSVSWLKTLHMGGIFHTHEDDPAVLVLGVHKNLNNSILSTCARVPFGRCLCGRAAAERKIQVSKRVDHRHDINYPGLEHHGHYNVPVLSGEKVLGVIVLYLPEGQDGDPYEISFLNAAASTLASMIKRKRAENALRQSEREAHVVTKAGEIRNAVLQFAPIPDTGRCIAGILDITDRIRAECELKMREMELDSQSLHLKEVNSALRVLLDQRERDRDELKNNVLNNVNNLVMPFIERLKACKLDSYYEAILEILEKNILNMVSPFINRLSNVFINLTPMEIQIANLIKEGKTSKEIANMLRRSENTVIFHRNNVRRKLGLKQAKQNLRSFLLSFEK